MRAIGIVGLVIVGLSGNIGEAQSGSKSANLKVSASVVATCRVTANPLAFGNYDPAVANASAPLDGTTTIDVACTRGVAPWIDLDYGANPASRTNTRRMVDSAGNGLEYELFKDAGRTSIWANFFRGVKLAAMPSAAPVTLTVYGRIAAGQDIPVGSYSDTVVVTAHF